MTEVMPDRARSATSLIVRTAARFGLEPRRMVDILKATAFRTTQPITDEQLAQLLIVAEQYHLNPFTRELHAFVDDKRGGIVVPVVGVDGWLNIINSHPQFDGMEIVEEETGAKCTVTIYRKDRVHPMTVTEWLVYCKRNTAPWTQNPPRMIRHKATMQCGRYAFGFAGIFDEDEAHTIVEGGVIERVEPPSSSAARVRNVLAGAGPNSEGSVQQSGAVGVNQPALAPDDIPFEPPHALDYLAGIVKAETIEDAAVVMEEARHVLTGAPLAELTAAYRAKWQPEPTEE